MSVFLDKTPLPGKHKRDDGVVRKFRAAQIAGVVGVAALSDAPNQARCTTGARVGEAWSCSDRICPRHAPGVYSLSRAKHKRAPRHRRDL